MTSEGVDDYLLFDICLEIANKVGGVYSVISSKTPTVDAAFKAAYATVGFWDPAKSPNEFVTEAPSTAIQSVIEAVAKRGVNVHYGSWLAEARVSCYLLEPIRDSDAWKDLCFCSRKWLGEQGISPEDRVLPCDGPLVNKVIDFGISTAAFFQEFMIMHPKLERLCDYRVVAHFHEWQASVGQLLLNEARPRIPELNALAHVFTSHATILGRLLAADGQYNNLAAFSNGLNIVEAERRFFKAQHLIERTSAHTADCFTTVSDVTSDEAAVLLDRAADIVTPNGIHIQTYDIPHTMQEEHVQARAKIDHFVSGFFRGTATKGAAETSSGEYRADQQPAKTLYVFTAGRYELTNKGYDVFIDSLGELDKRLREMAVGAPAGTPMYQVVAFLVVNVDNAGSIKTYTYDSERALRDLRTASHTLGSNLASRLELAATDVAHDPVTSFTINDLCDNKLVTAYRRARQAFALPPGTHYPLLTHNLPNEDEDPMIVALRRNGLTNGPENRVKVVFHPRFLQQHSSPVGLDYQDFVRGCHLGVFPSWYEPWGLTPAECVASGVPCITTNTAGVGRFIEEHRHSPADFYAEQPWRDWFQLYDNTTKDPEAWMPGVYVADRKNISPSETAARIASVMASFTRMNVRDRVELRSRTAKGAHVLDWSRLIERYDQAHHEAMNVAANRANK